MTGQTEKILICAVIALIALLVVPVAQAGQAVPVQVDLSNGRYQLLRDGEPYFIKGAGGKQHFDRLAAYGGNSIRTWSTENAQSILDQAQKLGLTVTLGLWMGHQNHGFDYDNEVIVARQLERFRQEVLKFKDHPALLMWGVGNEVNLNYSNTRVWDAVEDIAGMIAEVDGQHPVMTVLAGSPRSDVRLIMQKCPHVEILGINSYAALGNVSAELAQAGWDGPYLITEWGPNGYWEVPVTDWGAALEQNSTSKADTYRQRYEEEILTNLDRNLGSYVFLWGHKHEATPTWFGLFLEDGRETAMVDVMRYLWNGYWPENRAPEIGDPLIQGVTVEDVDIHVDPASDNQINASLIDPDGDAMTLSWHINHERAGNQIENSQKGAGAKGKIFLQGDEAVIQFVAPSEPGAYRLYLYAYDDHNHAATVNIPIYVD